MLRKSSQKVDKVTQTVLFNIFVELLIGGGEVLYTVSTNSEIFPNIFETYIFVNIPTEIYISLKLMYLEKLPNI